MASLPLRPSRPLRPRPLPLRRLPLIPGLLLSLSLLLGTRPAAAQTQHRSRASVDADNRRAQRQANRLENPYKESHLQPGRRLKRGEGDQPQAEGADQLRFENGKPVRTVGPQSVRRKRKEA